MFEGLITSLLNRILGDFVEGIKADQLSVSMFSGDVELFNLSIKPTILDNMPLPFKLRYGKVGRIFVDVPVTSLLSSPLKIEISEIFMLVEPKEVKEWNEKIIKDAFIAGVQSSLNGLEEYFKGQEEIKNATPGMASNMINSIIDNVQIDIRNIYIRFEDSISNPKMPYALGMSLEAIQLFTCDDAWKRAFVSGKDISKKMAKITNFQFFLNFSDESTGQPEKTKYDDLTEDITLEDVEDDEIREVIKTRQEKGVKPNPTLVRSKNFMLEDIKGKRQNRNIIEKLCIEARVKYNKDPKKNQMPMFEIDLVIGGKFKEGTNELIDDDEGTLFLKLQKQQLTAILKYLDYSTAYTKFQTGVQKKFLENKFTKEESKTYLTLYEDWMINKGDDKPKPIKQKAEKLAQELKEIESEYSYEPIAALRQISRDTGSGGSNKYLLEQKKKKEREAMLAEITEFERSKQAGYFSGFWGGKSEEEKTRDKREIQEFKARKNREFEEKFEEEEKLVSERIDNIMQEGEVMFDANALKDMPDEWVRMITAVIIPKLRLVLFDKSSTREYEKAIMEAQSSGMRTKAYLGQDFQEVELSFGKFNVIDNISGSDIYQFLTETVFPGSGESEGKDAIEIVFKSNPRFTDGQMKIKLRTNAHQYIFANMKLVNEVQEFFKTGEQPEDQVDLSYYTEQAKIKALEYINAGADYMESSANEPIEYVHSGIDADIEVFAPVIVIPESVSELTNKKTIVFSLGYTRVTSELRPYNKEIDYKLVNRGEELYDKYDLKLNGFQLSMIEELVDYKHWRDAKRKIDIINQIEVNLKANRSIEPLHPKFPKLELFCQIYEIDIFFSDYVAANLMKIQNSVFPPVEPKEEVERPSPRKASKRIVEIKDEEDEEEVETGKTMFKKFTRRPQGRNFEPDDSDEKVEELPHEEDQTDEENASVGEIKSLDMKRKSDVEEAQGNLRKKVETGPPRIDQRVLLFFDKMRITIGEFATNKQFKEKEYEGILDLERSEVPHMNILEMTLEGLEIEYDSGTAMNLHLIMSRLYMKDLQKIQEIRKGLVVGAKDLIPA